MPRRFAAASAIVLTAAVVLATPADAATARVVAHFDLAAHQQPENIALEPDGSADLTFSRAGQVARVSPNGTTEIIATLPAGGGVSGIVRASNGTLYINYRNGVQTGVWRLAKGHAQERIAPLPADAFPNGLALDARGANLYVTDSSAGIVYQVSINGGTPVVWAKDPAFSPARPGGFGSNGIKVHDSAVWVANTDTASLLRVPIRHDGSAGAVETKATGLTGFDDFTFVGQNILAALNSTSEVALVRPDGSHKVLLTAQDGLSNPTSVAVRGNRVYVPSAAYLTQRDPNLLIATCF
jgi:sugar lactone lactonase YvrE